jgi:prepilin-type N-terminal cleavage/methylation domain-containing protein
MKNKKGFTLIELLVVIGIIVFLAIVCVIALGSARQSARDSKRLSDLRAVQAHLEWYFADVNSYPVIPAPGITLGDPGTSCLNKSGFAGKGCIAPYLDMVPADPGDTKYVYSSADGTSYMITASLEGDVNGLQGQIKVTPSGIQ